MSNHSGGWDGARNLVDLGGLPLLGGGHTRAGAVWCSAAPEWLTSQGWRAARAAGLTRIVDLRNDRERVRRPEHPAKFARVFTAIAEADGGVLVHCAGGRDRTGMVSSALLSLVGVTPEAIAGHYERGFRGAAAHRGHGTAYDPTSGQWVSGPSGPARTDDELDELIADRRPALLDWARTADIAGYLERAGVDRPHLDRLRTRLRP